MGCRSGSAADGLRQLPPHCGANRGYLRLELGRADPDTGRMPPEPVAPAVFHALVILNLLFVTGAWSLARPSYPVAAVLAALSGAWFFWNGPIEGHVLISFTLERGFTESDILCIVGIVLAGVACIRTRERRRWEE